MPQRAVAAAFAAGHRVARSGCVVVVRRPDLVLVLTALLAVVITGPMFGSWRLRGTAANWVVAVTPQELWLNLRDCEFQDAAAAETIVAIRLDELESAGRVDHRYILTDFDGDEARRKDVHLELVLKEPQAMLLEKLLVEDQRLKPPATKYLGGIVKVSTNRQHAPVSVEDAHRIRIKFTSGNYGLTPGIKQTLEVLRPLVTVAERQALSTGSAKELSEPEYDALLVKYVRAGQVFDATRLVCARTGKSLTDGRRFVAELEEQLKHVSQ